MTGVSDSATSVISGSVVSGISGSVTSGVSGSVTSGVSGSVTSGVSGSVVSGTSGSMGSATSGRPLVAVPAEGPMGAPGVESTTVLLSRSVGSGVPAKVPPLAGTQKLPIR